MTATIHRLPKREHVPNLNAVCTVAGIFKNDRPGLLGLARDAIRRANITSATPWDQQHAVDSLLMAYVATGLLLGASIEAIVAAIPPHKLPR